MSSSSAAVVLHKGKLQRSWPQLPADVLGLIARHFLAAVYASMDTPDSWTAERDTWESRNVYVHLRIATELERLMYVCPSWYDALENNGFWDNATGQIDPNGAYDRYRVIYPPPSSARAPPPIAIPAYKHFKRAYALSCAVCRINRPHTLSGLDLPSAARRQGWCAALGTLSLCRDHRRTAFCGSCLREPAPWPAPRKDQLALSLYANDDARMFPHVAMTCRSCRQQALDRVIRASGLARWALHDPESDQSMDWFVDAGEGTVDEVVRCIREKQWLLEHTRVNEFTREAVATARYLERLEDVAQGNDMEDDDEDDEIDDEAVADLAQPEHFLQARDMAATDWARTRILDGHWVSPGDDYYEVQRTVGRAEHPAPWTLGTANSSSPVLPPSADGIHPTQKSISTRRAPTYRLAQQLYSSFTSQMSAIIGPALHNVAKRLLLTAADPAATAARMSVHDVVRELQQPYAWAKELDAVCCPPLVLPPRRTVATTTGTSPSASSSVESAETDATSPVLSSSTVLTTPSPPPKSDDADMASSDADNDNDGDTTLRDIEGEGGLDAENESDSARERERVEKEEKAKTGVPPPAPDNMLRAIPYVPRTLVGIPDNSIAIIRSLWREASAPLYTCTCSICARARGAHYGQQAQTQGQHQGQHQGQGQSQITVPSQPPLVQVRLPQAGQDDDDDDMDDEDDDWGVSMDSDTADYSDEDMDVHVERPVAQHRPANLAAAPAPLYRLQSPPTGLDATGGLNANGKRPVSVTVQEESRTEDFDPQRGPQDSSALRAAVSRRQSAGIPPDATPPRAALRLATPPPEGTPPKRARLELVTEPGAVVGNEGEGEAQTQTRMAKRRSEDLETIPTLSTKLVRWIRSQALALLDMYEYSVQCSCHPASTRSRSRFAVPLAPSLYSMPLHPVFSAFVHLPLPRSPSYHALHPSP
ncbi:unnamed protein product [Peniophora sp. CBMAI 1063]|nr:unnamed protein product [Peniophora sp. CBMAI 1063]